jgi:glycosyltransferase involved in cell wall biosynthesis
MKFSYKFIQILSFLPMLISLINGGQDDAVADGIEQVEEKLTMQNTTFHLLAIPHTAVNPKFSVCPFTMKVWRLCRLLTEVGIHTVLYGNEGSDAQCDVTETILSSDERQEIYGNDSLWESGDFFDYSNAVGRAEYAKRTVAAIQQKMEERPDHAHIILSSWGTYDLAVVRKLGEDITTIEAGVGYHGSWSDFRVYESYSWMATQTPNLPINYYHTVISSCFYADEFEGTVPYRDDTPYFLFVGRLNEDKGLPIVREVMKRMPNHKIHIAGQGDWEGIWKPEFVDDESNLQDRVVYHGVLRPKERNELMMGAQALITPTVYKEPLGKVMMEAQWLGTPVITTDHAAFAETIWHGVSGYRCRTLRCFVGAAQQSQYLDRRRIQERAQKTFSCEITKHRYRDFFQDVFDYAYNGGWYDLKAGSGHLLDQRDFYPDARLEEAHGPTCSSTS